MRNKHDEIPAQTALFPGKGELVEQIRPPSLISIAKSYGHYLSNYNKARLLFLALVALTSAFAESLNILIIFPFLGILINGSVEQPLPFHIEAVLKALNLNNSIYSISIIVIISAIFSAGVRLINIWLNAKFAASVGTELSCRCYFNILNRPYGYHIKTNRSSIVSTIAVQIQKVSLAIDQLLAMATAVLVSVAIVGILFVINKYIAVVSIFSLITVYVLFALSTKSSIAQNGRKTTTLSQKQLQVLQEGLGSIRDVLIDRKQHHYVDVYKRVDKPLRQANANLIFLSRFPRYLLEASGVILLTLIVIFMKSNNVENSVLIPAIGVLAVSAQRLLPNLQQIYSSWANIKGSVPALSDVLGLLRGSSDIQRNDKSQASIKENKIAFESLEFRRVSYAYDESASNSIEDISFTLRKGEKLGIIGETGAGKSTIIDLILGLLRPTDGKILLNGKEISNIGQLEKWQSILAHVPQDIFLMDGTLVSNIAFGVLENEVDYEVLVECSAAAQILTFVQELPERFSSIIGEQGSKLSGGQRQRIGLARAFYKSKPVLILDEATSALDVNTETAVMQNIDQSSLDRTMILIAHRTSTLKICTKIMQLNKGRILKVGPPDDFIL